MDELLDSLANLILIKVKDNEEFIELLSAQSIGPISEFLVDEIEDIVTTPLSNLLTTKIEDMLELKSHDFDWEYDDDDEEVFWSANEEN